MGDKLPTGWADPKAKEPFYLAARRSSRNHRQYELAMDGFFKAQTRTEALMNRWEIEAEEAMLP